MGMLMREFSLILKVFKQILVTVPAIDLSDLLGLNLVCYLQVFNTKQEDLSLKCYILSDPPAKYLNLP